MGMTLGSSLHFLWMSAKHRYKRHYIHRTHCTPPSNRTLRLDIETCSQPPTAQPTTNLANHQPTSLARPADNAWTHPPCFCLQRGLSRTRRAVQSQCSSMSEAQIRLNCTRMASHQRPRLAFQKFLPALSTVFTERPIYS